MPIDDKGLLLKGTWSEVGGFKESTDFGATLKLMFLGDNPSPSGTAVTLTMGTGPDHSTYDVYVGSKFWQSFDGSGSTGQVDINITLDSEGPHVLEIRNRPERNKASRGYKVRFKQLVILDRTFTLHTIEYSYDALSRLIEARYNPNVNVNAADADLLRRYQYAFDLSGNRTQQIVTVAGIPTTTNYTYNAANQLTSGSATYDNNGNLTNDGTNAYTWDRANRLLSMGGTSFKYDGEGHRIQQTASGIATDYLLDIQPGLSVVLGATKSGSTTRYVHSLTGIHAQKDSGGNWSWMLHDGLQSVRVEANNTLGVIASGSYAPYGDVFGVNGTFDTMYRFTGEPLDSVPLTYLRARYLNSQLGIFTNLDPYSGTTQRPMSLNGYSYVEGNVVNATDPSGLQACTLGYVPFHGKCVLAPDMGGDLSQFVDKDTICASKSLVGIDIRQTLFSLADFEISKVYAECLLENKSVSSLEKLA